MHTKTFNCLRHAFGASCHIFYFAQPVEADSDALFCLSNAKYSMKIIYMISRLHLVVTAACFRQITRPAWARLLYFVLIMYLSERLRLNFF